MRVRDPLSGLTDKHTGCVCTLGRAEWSHRAPNGEELVHRCHATLTRAMLRREILTAERKSISSPGALDPFVAGAPSPPSTYGRLSLICMYGERPPIFTVNQDVYV